MHIYIFTYIHAYRQTHTLVHIYVYIHTYVCVNIYVYIHTYVCVGKEGPLTLAILITEDLTALQYWSEL